MLVLRPACVKGDVDGRPARRESEYKVVHAGAGCRLIRVAGMRRRGFYLSISSHLPSLIGQPSPAQLLGKWEPVSCVTVLHLGPEEGRVTPSRSGMKAAVGLAQSSS